MGQCEEPLTVLVSIFIPQSSELRSDRLTESFVSNCSLIFRLSLNMVLLFVLFKNAAHSMSEMKP